MVVLIAFGTDDCRRPLDDMDPSWIARLTDAKGRAGRPRQPQPRQGSFRTPCVVHASRARFEQSPMARQSPPTLINGALCKILAPCRIRGPPGPTLSDTIRRYCQWTGSPSGRKKDKESGFPPPAGGRKKLEPLFRQRQAIETP